MFWEARITRGLRTPISMVEDGEAAAYAVFEILRSTGATELGYAPATALLFQPVHITMWQMILDMELARQLDYFPGAISMPSFTSQILATLIVAGGARREGDEGGPARGRRRGQRKKREKCQTHRKTPPISIVNKTEIYPRVHEQNARLC